MNAEAQHIVPAPIRRSLRVKASQQRAFEQPATTSAGVPHRQHRPGSGRIDGELRCEAGAMVDTCTAGAPADSDATCDGIDSD